ncbi:MAG TPA: ACT domain-containing protein [bacterium]|nr:ACT domain-containing protein [bacterium]
MKPLIAISAIGQDRPGIVAALSKVLFEVGCNLEDSSMTRLRGDFAVLLLVSLPEGLALSQLEEALGAVAGKLGLTHSVRVLNPSEAAASKDAGLPHTLVVYGLDHPGIVYRVTQAAADRKMNITDLRTHVTNGPSGPLYSLAVDLDAPDAASAAAFAKDLEALKKELKVEITFQAQDTEEL